MSQMALPGPWQCDWYVQRLEKLKMEGRDDVDFDTVLEMLRAEETAREKAAEAEETEVGRQPSDEAQRWGKLGGESRALWQ